MRDAVWDRVIAAAEERAPGRGMQWLAEQLNYKLQRVQNWKTRGVPGGEYPALAAALDKSVDWVAGKAPRISLADAIAGLAEAMRQASPTTREAVAPLLSRIAVAPGEAEHWARTIVAITNASPPDVPTHPAAAKMSAEDIMKQVEQLPYEDRRARKAQTQTGETAPPKRRAAR